MNSNNSASPETKSIQIMQKLKKETKGYHSKLESLPYFHALIDHKLPLECYVNQLRALAIIHSSLEQELASSTDNQIRSVWDNDLRKLALLEEDLRFFKPRVIPDTNKAIEAALSMTEKIRLRKIEKPVTLLGYLYVFEGSILGNSMHRPDITKTFHLSGLNGCLYYSGYREKVQSHWNQFLKTMNKALADPSLHESILSAAHEAFSGLESLYTALFPLSKNEKSFHVTRLNPEAGNHPIPEDKREIEAALKASDRGWVEFPYYKQRYGNRGKRFSDSDSCWIVTLTDLDQETLNLQIDWLCRVLATRGMPSIMMEQTLKYLAEELTRALPDKAACYSKLTASADALEGLRMKWFHGTDFNSLVTRFDVAVGPEMAKKYKNIGCLIVSAVADEKNGIEGSVDILQKWLTDKERFPDEWIQIVNETFEKADNAIGR